jgi:hypothetical protein
MLIFLSTSWGKVQLDVGIFRFTALGGAGLFRSESTDKWSYNFGGNVACWFLDGSFFIGIGGGIEGPTITNNGNYPFARLSFGMGGYRNKKRVGVFSTTSLSVYYDYNFDDNGFKLGLLVGPLSFLSFFW